MTYSFKTVATPVGVLKLVASDAALVAILWENDDPKRMRVGRLVEDADHVILCTAERQLGEYFAGTRKRFNLPLCFSGTTFQRQVWAELLNIPFGHTRTYAEIAAAIGKPRAFRAVGATNGRNPLSIVAPCHRVIGKDGSLTGFAGGLQAKNYLLALEAP
jgi:methylated-DNA-[protein]-cysteine S-methyltransferase